MPIRYNIIMALKKGVETRTGDKGLGTEGLGTEKGLGTERLGDEVRGQKSEQRFNFLAEKERVRSFL